MSWIQYSTSTVGGFIIVIIAFVGEKRDAVGSKKCFISDGGECDSLQCGQCVIIQSLQCWLPRRGAGVEDVDA